MAHTRGNAVAASYLLHLPDQNFLLPPTMSQWLPEGHLAHFISDTINGVDLPAFRARCASDDPRNQPCHLALMVELLGYR